MIVVNFHHNRVCNKDADMFEYLKKYFSGPKCFISAPEWFQWLNSIHQYQVNCKNSYLANPLVPIGTGRQILRNILKIADIPRLCQMPNNAYVYMTQVDSILQDVKRQFGDSRDAIVFRNTFSCCQNGTVHELVISTDDNNWPVFLPFHSNDIDDWKTVQPLVYWDTTTCEQSADIKSVGILRYRQTAPYTVWLLDIVSLIFKAMQYYRAHQDDEHRVFIHTVIGDSLDWSEYLRSLKVVSVLSDDLLSWKTKKNLLTNRGVERTTYSYIGNKWQSAFSEMMNLLSQLKGGELTPAKFFNAPLFYSPVSWTKVSIAEMVNLFEQRYNLSHRGKYKYWLILRDFPYVSLLQSIYEIASHGKLSEYGDFKKNLAKTARLSLMELKGNGRWIQETTYGKKCLERLTAWSKM